MLTDRAGSRDRRRIGAEVSSPNRSLVPAVREQVIGDGPEISLIVDPV